MTTAMPTDPLARRLTVAEFATATQRCAEVVRRWIRANEKGIKRHVSGRPYLIDPAALALFNVRPELARSLLSPRKKAA